MSPEENSGAGAFQADLQEHRSAENDKATCVSTAGAYQAAGLLGKCDGHMVRQLPGQARLARQLGVPRPLAPGSRPCDRTPSLDGARPGPASSHEPALGKRAGGTRPQLAGHNAGKRAEARGYHHRKATASPAPRAAGLAAGRWAGGTDQLRQIELARRRASRGAGQNGRRLRPAGVDLTARQPTRQQCTKRRLMARRRQAPRPHCQMPPRVPWGRRRSIQGHHRDCQCHQLSGMLSGGVSIL